MSIVQASRDLQKRHQCSAMHVYGVCMVVILCIIRLDFYNTKLKAYYVRGTFANIQFRIFYLLPY